MKKLKLSDVTQYVEKNVSEFHRRRLQNLEGLKLTQVLKRKNPYLYKAKNVLTSEQIIRSLTDARISSSEETTFGDWLEGLAIFVNGKVFGGRKSGIAGIDLEFDRAGVRYIVNIKSGPNWANKSQIDKMKLEFKSATKSLRTSNSGLKVVAVNGCCYGRDSNPDKGDFFKYCGQRFWEFISANSQLYLEIIEPLGHQAKLRNDEFENSYAKVINKFTLEFSKRFCNADGSIDWNGLTKFSSAIDPKDCTS